MFYFYEFRIKWGAAYKDLSILDKMKLFFYIQFIIRRIFYLSIAFYLFENSTFQILFLLYSSLAASMYVGYSRPKVWWRHVWLENINEWFVFMITFHLVFFTDYIASASM